jgi:hypothetical protein
MYIQFFLLATSVISMVHKLIYSVLCPATPEGISYKVVAGVS